MKAQIAVEFLSYSIIFLIAMGVMLSVVSILGLDLIGLQKSNALKQETQRIANALALAKGGGENFIYRVDLNKRIAGYPYKIVFLPESISISLLKEENLNSEEIEIYSVAVPLTSYCLTNRVEVLSSSPQIEFRNKNSCIEVVS